MTRTLATSLQELISNRVLAEIPYVTVTVVTDFGENPPTLDTPIRLSTYPFVDDLSGTDGLPFLRRITFPLETIPHLPDSRALGGVDATNRVISVTLANVPYGDAGEFLYDLLTANGRLDRALVQLDTHVLSGSDFRSAEGRPHFFDARAAPLLNLIPHFSGRVERVLSVGDEITFTAKTDLPTVDWKLVPDDGGDPRDRGLRLPYPLGSNAIVRCGVMEIGVAGSTAARFAIGDTEIDVEILPGEVLPATGTGLVSGERIEWAGLQGTNRLTGITRGLFGSSEADHIIGSPFIVVDPILLAVSTVPISSVNDLFVLSTSRLPIRVSKLGYSVNLDNQSDAPGSSGDGIATIAFSSAQMAALVSAVYADLAVTRQAEYSTGNIVPNITTDDFPQANQTTQTGTGALGNWTNVTSGTTTWTANTGGNRDDLASDIAIGDIQRDYYDTLREMKITFTVDVTSLSKSIVLGVQLSGAENILLGVPDGSLVASAVITDTGVQTIEGTTFAASEFAIVGGLEDLTIEFIKTDVSGNPTIVIELTSIDIVYVSLQDHEDHTVELTRQEFFQDHIDYSLVASNVVDGTARSDMWTIDVGAAGQLFIDRLAAGSQGYSSCKMDFITLSQVPTPTPDGTLFIKEWRILIRLDQDVVCDPAKDVRVSLIPIVAAGSNVFRSGVNPVLTGTWADGQISSGTSDEITFVMRSDTGGILRQGVTYDDLRNIEFAVWIQADVPPDTPSDTHIVNMDEHFVGFDFAVKSGQIKVDRQVDAQIQANAGGIGFEFFALCDGPVAGHGSYTDANTGELVETAADIVNYWLTEVGGFDEDDDLDSVSFDAASTVLSDYVFGFDARNAGNTWAAVLARLAYETRSNICRPSGADWQMLQADETFVFPTPTITLSDLSDVKSIGKDDDEISTRLTVFSGFDPRSDSQDNRAYQEVQTTVTGDSLVIAREDAFGRQDADPFNLICHTVAGTTGVTDWRLYMEQELGRFARIVSARVQHWDAYSLELGDVVNLSDPTLGASVVKARVIEVQRNQEQGFLIRFAEVL